MRRADDAVRIKRAHKIAVAAFVSEVDRRRRALLAAANVAQIDRLAEPACGLADQQDGFPSRLKASVADLVKSSMRPTPPMVGVGRMPWPLVSL